MSLLNVLNFIVRHPINRGRPFASLLRFAKWQINSRLASTDLALDWINGSKFFARNGETGITGNIYTGLHEFPDMGFLLHFLRPEDRFVDIGANVGSYTILASAVVGSESYAFEPVPSTYSRLLANIRLNAIESRVSTFNIGLGDVEDNLAFTSDLDTVNHVVSGIEPSVNPISIPVMPFDGLGLGAVPQLMKIDVEGYEKNVLIGAMNTLKAQQLHSVIMELNGSGMRYGTADSDILSIMLDLGFLTYTYDPFSRSLVDLHGTILPIGNTIFIRNVDYVQDRLLNAPQFRVLGRTI